MLSWIRKHDLRKAGIISAAVGVMNIVLHLLVISEILPYMWVNGGRSLSLADAQETSFVSIILTVFSILIALIASGIIPVKFNRFWGIALSIFLIAALPLSLVGVIQQFLGTTFEKCVTSIITIVGFCANGRIALEKRW